jgi:WD40 repeat protein
MSSELDVVLSGDLGGLVCVHTIRRGEFIRSVVPKSNAAGAAVRKLALDGHGTFAVYVADQNLHVYSVNGALLCSSNAADVLHDMKICSSGETLVTGGIKGQLAIRSMQDLRILATLDISKHGPILCISLTPDDLNPIPQYLFIGSHDGMITIVSEDPNAPSEDDLIVFSRA